MPLNENLGNALPAIINLNLHHATASLGVDGFDDEAGIRLTMANGLALIRFRLVLVNTDFLAKALFFDLAINGSALHIGSANFRAFATNEKNFVDRNVLTSFHVELFNVDLVTDFDFDLLSASFNI